MGSITMIDISGIYALEDLINNAKNNKIKVIVSNASESIKKILNKVNFINNIGIECYKDSKDSVTLYVLQHYNLQH